MQEDDSFLMVFVASAMLIAIILILVFLFLIAYQKKMVLQRMHLQEIENSYQLELLQATIEGQERERKRIASDLHDHVGSLLSALKLNVMHLEQMPETGEGQRQFLQQTRVMLEDGLKNVRHISHNLLPPSLTTLGLWKALEEWTQHIDHTATIHVSLHIDKVPDRLPINIEFALFRVVQELLNNSLRHANATNILLAFDTDKDQLTFTYADDGTGLGEKGVQAGLGMTNMHSRLRAINSKMEIDELKEKGFGASVYVPLTSKIS